MDLRLVAKTVGKRDSRTRRLPRPPSECNSMNEKLLPILADTLGVEAGTLSIETSTENTPAWDSVAHLNLVLSLEQAFGQRFTPEEFMQMQSVAAIQRVLAAHGVP